MKVKIGPYLNWWGPYQIAQLLLGNPEKTYDWTSGTPKSKRLEWADRLGDWLAKTWVADFCQWVHDKRQRMVYVRIDNYDVWNMDDTLRHIIGPMFIKLKEIKHGFGFIADEDAAEDLRSDHAPAEREYEWDKNAEARYEWLLDEMIWAFTTDHEEVTSKFYDHSAVNKNADLNTQIRQMKVDRESLDAYQARLQNAYQLFGKYYQTFWD